jgi:hypothetical protein
MVTVTLLRDLWRLRLAVLGVWLFAMLAGALVLYKASFPPESRKYDVGVATTSILVDTPSSQVVEISPEGSDMLGLRADLLSRLMVAGSLKNLIAQTAGVRPNTLVGIAATSAVGAQPVVPPPGHDAPVLTTRVVEDNDGTELPIIEVEAQAPTAAGAAELADAAVESLHKFLDSKAATQQIPNAKRLKVDALGVTQAETVTRGPKSVFGVAAVLFTFGFGCACILLFAALKRNWRSALTAESAPPMPAPVPVPMPVHQREAFAPVMATAAESHHNGSSSPVRSAPVPPPPAGGDSWLSPPPRPSLSVAPNPLDGTTPEPSHARSASLQPGDHAPRRRRRSSASGSADA